MKKLITIVFSIAIMLSANASIALASGNPYGAYSVYSPYETHTPVDTGFEDTSIFYTVALVTFTAGLSILAIAKNLKGSKAILSK